MGAGLWQHGAMDNDQALPTAHSLEDIDRRRLVRAATRLLGPVDAEDAVQDAYVRALEANDATLVLNSTQAWLHTVVRNMAIDRLRRRNWIAQWLQEEALGGGANDALRAAPSAESDAALAEEVAQALRLMAAHLAPEDGAAVLLHEVFEASHTDIAHAAGRSEAGNRQHHILVPHRRNSASLRPQLCACGQGQQNTGQSPAPQRQRIGFDNSWRPAGHDVVDGPQCRHHPDGEAGPSLQALLLRSAYRRVVTQRQVQPRGLAP